MQLPKRFKLNKRAYTVSPLAIRTGRTTGYFYPAVGVIMVATTSKGAPRKPQAVQTTFWHEATHAILHDMGHPLTSNEQFVTAFSTRLVKLINTSEF
jgi:antirestriction protein ArdC